jgi:hypothetical protein
VPRKEHMTYIQAALRRCVAAAALALALTIHQQSAQALDPQLENALVSSIEARVCQDGGQWLRCYGEDSGRCQSVASDFARPCVKSVLGAQAGQMQYEEGVAAAKKLVACFNERFMSSYGSKKLTSPECAQPPQHLQD